MSDTSSDNNHAGRSLKVREIRAKSILSRSKVFPYVINPYVGCQHACSYCYARFMKKFTGHREAWGLFVDVKINAPELLKKDIRGKKKAAVWISGVCDPYQPLEEKYRLSRQCLGILALDDWPVVIQTRSPLVLRDVDILKEFENVEVGFSIATADDEMRKLFESGTSSIPDRISALEELHGMGIRTYAMIAPLLPGAEGLIEHLAGAVDYVLVDRMNYHHAGAVYRKHRLQEYSTEAYFNRMGREIGSRCSRLGIKCRVVY